MRFKDHIDILDHLAKIAQADETKKWKLAAAVTQRNRVLSIGLNSRKTHPFQAKYSRMPEFNCIHAEIAAIHNYLRTHSVDDLRNCTLYVCRVKRTGPKKSYTWGNAKPCCGCMKAIIEFDIRNVVYSLDETHNFEVLQ